MAAILKLQQKCVAGRSYPHKAQPLSLAYGVS
jgi:hypothetical protein